MNIVDATSEKASSIVSGSAHVTLKLCMNYTVVIIFEFRGPDRVITAKLSLSEEKIRANAFLTYR